MIKNIFVTIGFIAILIGIFLVGLVVYWVNYDYDIADIKGTPLPSDSKDVIRIRGVKIISASVSKGVSYEVDGCKNKPYSALRFVQIVDGLTYSSPREGSNNPLGCKKTPRTLILPANFPPGRYESLTVNFEYQANPLRTIRYEISSDPFTVVE